VKLQKLATEITEKIRIALLRDQPSNLERDQSAAHYLQNQDEAIDG
jgi:hypothetical protein